tara:strand:+ start:9682 stop:9963 length:282 start_codon:yes stop_codon:yes gene_type:complete
MKEIFVALGLSVAGCASQPPPEPIVRTIEVKVPVITMISCVPDDFDQPPNYIDTDAALLGAADAAERYHLVTIGRDERTARLAETEAVIEACR